MQILGVSCSLVLRDVMLSNYAVARARVSGWGPVSSVGCRLHLEGARLHSCEIREGGFGGGKYRVCCKRRAFRRRANFREVLDTEEGFKEGGRNELAAMQMLPGLWT